MNQHSTGEGKQELRRHKRLRAEQPAQLVIPGEAAVDCEIRDYCPTGLFLAFGDAYHENRSIPPLVGSTVGVEFTGTQGLNTGVIRLEGKVAHLSAAGVGLYVPAMPANAIEALQYSATAPAKAPLPALDLSPEQIQTIRQDCRQRMRSFLDTVVEAFFLETREKLASTREEAGYMQQSQYQYGINVLRERRNDIQAAFKLAIEHDIELLESEASPPAASADLGDLALVDETSFENWLALSAEINKVELDIHLQLANFERRYGRLTTIPFARNNNPFGPEAISRSLDNALQGLDFTDQVQSIVYKTLGKVLARLLPSFYQQLNEIVAPVPPVVQPIISAEPVPVPAAESGVEHSPPPPAELARQQVELTELADKLLKLYRHGDRDTSTPEESALYNFDHILAAAGQSAGGGARPSPTGERAAQGRQVSTSHSLSQLADRLSEILSQLTRPAPVTDLTAGTASAIAPPYPSASQQSQLLALLDRVSLHPGDRAISLPDATDSQLPMHGAETIAPSQRQTLDTMGRLLSLAAAEYAPESEIESLFRKLERPLIKLALTDPSFLSEGSHPARQVINLLDEYAIGADDHGKFFDPRLFSFLSLLIERIATRADQDPAVFKLARDHLARLIEPIKQSRRQRVAVQQESCEGKERVNAARSRTYAALRQRLENRRVPVILLRLLNVGWRQYLTLTDIRHSDSNDEWLRGIEIVDRLMAWLTPERERGTDFGEAARSLLHTVEDKLASVNVEPSRSADILDELNGLLLRPVPGRAAVMATVPPNRPDGSKPARDDSHAMPPSLPIRLTTGEWWQLPIQGNSKPMQLIWVSDPPHTCAFVNRSATRRHEIGLDELARMIDEGTACLAGDKRVPLFERTELAALDDVFKSLAHQANHDPVTGLINRKGFLLKVQHETASGPADRIHTLCIIDFDQFRMIYNTCGTECGDTLARNLCTQVRSLLGPNDVLSSFHGATFAMFLPDQDRSAGLAVANHLLQRLKDFRFQHGKEHYNIGVSIGVVEYSPSLTSLADAVRHADSACLAAKSRGRNQLEVYDASNSLFEAQESLLSWAGRIDTILEHEGLYLRCQKVMPMGGDSGQLPYYEILLGIRDEGGAEIAPMQFIPAVERWNRAHEIDLWVLRAVFAWVRANRSTFDRTGGFSINLSALSLTHPEVLAYLHQELSRTDLPTEKIAFEITETTAINNYTAAEDFIRQIRRYGCKFSLDDFGSGYASFAHLKRLCTDTLKIDGSFVMAIDQSPADFAMVRSMNEIGHALGMKTVAEFAHSAVILGKLREIGVDYVQGYVIHKPMPIDQLLSGSEGP